MATTFAVGVDPGHGPHTTAASLSTAAHQAHLSAHQHNNSAASTTTSNASNKSFSSNNSIFDAHRQNHNSSKLPAFRFADLKKDAVLPSLPSLLHHIPPSPVSPQTNIIDGSGDGQQQQPQPQQLDAHDQPATNQDIPGLLPDGLNIAQNPPKKSPTPETAPLQSLPPHQASPPRTRASTFQTTVVPTANEKPDPSVGSKRPASFPDAPSIANTAYAPRAQSSSTVTPAAKRRLTASGVASAAETLTSHQNLTATTNDDPSSTKEWAQGQRELLLPKTVETAKSDDRRKSRPPVSYRPPNATGGRAVIPPIRSFRSSGSRKSLVLDMHVRRVSDDSYGEDIGDTNQRDRTLRALEGRQDDDFSQITPPDSADAIGDSENTADLFMRIAREDPNPAPEEYEKPADQSAISRITRVAHRRPLSAAVPTYQATSPPQITRRLSDQRENTRTRQLPDGQATQQMTRELAYRSSARERPTSTTTTIVETSARPQIARTPLRPSPITPRQISFQDPTPDTGSAYRRRQSVTESNAGTTVSRPSQYRNPNLALGGQGRTYNSSPLVPRSTGLQKDEPQPSVEVGGHGVEGTESSASTTAPSTMWDELDDLKSRIHRLELTGKAPSTSGAAMSRASDDRPPTATTNATTISASPKRGSGPGASQPDASSTTSSQREAQPILLSALSKTKGIVSNDVFCAIEAAATDALALTTMVGVPGQLGPISSGASMIGGVNNVTDRQLRRKADSICRSLTELCIALADEAGPTKAGQSASAPREKELEPLTSPTVTKFAPLPPQRRPSTLVDSTPTKPAIMSPRAPTSLEQRRLTMLASATLPSPRYALAPLTPVESTGAGRKTSLLLSRTRRAGTEEPEEVTGRGSSLLLRTRRAGTEEPEESREAPQGRKTSLLVRSRKLSNDDEDEPRFRVPSRAITEVNSFRTTPREANTQSQASPPDSNPLGSSALPRRRLLPSSLNPRLVTPATPSSASSRRYFDRPTPDRETNTVAEKLAEDRGQRQFSLSQTAVLNRTGSISTRRTRESTIVQNGQTGGSYR